ncbi:MAG: DUF2213 domain-containing protein [Hyphomicrobiaceae bacterium]|nr:MAG: DUF2213 domain-containing protein [Hyphomicrobiaceae bacterium]
MLRRWPQALGYSYDVNFRIDFRGPLGKAQLLSDGSLKVPAFLARTGVQDYTYSDGRKVREHRPAEQVFSQSSLDTFKGLAVTVQHPNAKVDPSSWKTVSIGHVGDDVRQEGDHVAASLYIKDAETIRKIQSGELVEISNGYECKMVAQPGRNDAGEEYDAIQTDIVGNHVALGPSNWGRAGRNVRLYLDSKEANTESAIIAFSSEDSEMTDEEKKAKAEADKKAAEDKAKAEAASKAKEEAERKESEAAAEKAEKEALAKAEAEKTGEAPAGDQTPAPESGQVKLPGNIDSADAVKFDAAVDERLEVVANARRIMGEDFAHKGKSNAQIRAEVVSAKGVKCDGKDDSYVAARFDALIEAAVKQDAADNALGNLREDANKTTTKLDKAEEARANMVKANTEAWKNKSKPRGQK